MPETQTTEDAEDAKAAAEDDRSRSVLVNTGWLIGSRLAQAVLGWGGTLLIARTMSLEEFGRFTTIFTVLGLMVIVTDMGIGRIAVRGMLGEDDTLPGAATDPVHFAGAYIGLRSLLGVVGYVLVLLVVTFLGYPMEVVGATAVAGIVIVLSTPSSALDVVFQARLQMGIVSAAGVAGLVAQFALTAAIAAAGGSLLLFIIPAVLCQVVVLSWKIPAARRLLPIRLIVDWTLWKRLLREALPLTLGIGLATVYYRVDALMLSKLDGFDAVGVYGVSYKFVDLLQFAATAVTVPLLTVLVQSWPGDPSAFRAAGRRAAMLLGVLGGLAIVGLVGFATPLTTSLYGAGYAVGDDATRLLVVATTLALFGSLAMTCLVAVGRNRGYPLVMLTGLVLNVGANLVLIPRYSYHGAAAATLASEVVVLALLLTLLLRHGELRPLGLGRLVVMPLAIGVGLGVGYAGDLVLPWVLAAGLAAAAFVAVAVLGGLTRAAGLGLPRRRTA
ncbi:oligosaccharide flippase family protein [Nocardioides sp.]|uniref:oligosaccharide flippase family protein n=1 Tax=Nocardioides sp. TaxID=35761 RepID=UPI002716416C|nr:oligosaccharide flippase family protein [Nocardioides sp.]MDO9454930.1 oligosaccharide flippase family protein [Nocardioides sp.]